MQRKKIINRYRNRLRISRRQVKLPCLIYLLVNALNLKKCCCPCEQRVPIMEQQFLLDQRSQRKMAIGSVDVETTNKNEKKIIED